MPDSRNVGARAEAQSDAITMLGDAQRARDDGAVERNRLRNLVGTFALLLSPFAITFFAARSSLPRDATTLAVALTVGEVTLLAVAVALGLLHVGASHDEWITNRIRAELLRREEFLLRARIGPYLFAADDAVADVAYRRGRLVDSDDVDPVPLIPMRDGPGATWRDALEDAVGTDARVPDLAAALRHYCARRLVTQRTWFVKRSHEHHRSDRRLEGIATVALLIALIVALLHLLLLDRESSPGEWLLTFIALVAPAVGTAAIALRSFWQSHRLSRSYRYYGRALAEIEDALRELERTLVTETAAAVITVRGEGVAAELTATVAAEPNDRAEAVNADAERAFKRLVLHAEDLLSQELRQWWLAVGPAEPKAGP